MEIVVPEEFKYLYEVSEKRPVVKIPAGVLREIAKPVEQITPKTKQLVERMERIMKLANGVGLAAPQLGVSERVIVICPSGTKPLAMINPEIVEMSEEKEAGQEGCLSIPGLYGDVERSVQITMEAYDIKGRAFSYELQGMAARIAQHEMDHLDGVLFIDKVDPATLHWQTPDGEQE